ncbi:retroviral-like aspartic protease family protein [Pelomonas sp. SE-A7]|uniref:retroviral-like aspartic protease family protein n=1 Tax=Pelomonas sp. SE-A7 TaxID=3054953 RepID=UPI00259CDA07|nr:retroviral-like aspartic protease family protein [Pelomonas sp. SE-A7]MDM4767030.1 retroviral-like aspartic protease family protein [Pelomonas sp. SE-A7]
MTKTRKFKGASLRLAAVLALAMTGVPVLAACKLQSLEIPVRLADGRPIAKLGINGTELPMLVDSGAFFSMLPESTAAQLGLVLRPLPTGLTIEGYTGRIEARMAKVDKVSLQGFDIPNVEFVVGGNELNAGLKGILGRNFLAVTDTEYDLANGVVRLHFPQGECRGDMAYWAGDAPVIGEDLVGRDDALRVTVRINDRRFKAVLDTGAPSTSIKIRTARRAVVEEQDMTLVGKVGGAGEGRVRSWTANVANFELGGEKIANNRFSIDETSQGDHDMLIGLDYFLSHRIYVSHKQRKLYATWNGGPVFAKLGGAGVSNEEHAAKPDEPAADDDQALANRASAALLRGDTASALRDLNRACELAPQQASHFHARAKLLLSLRKPREAMKDLDQALQLDPAGGEARLTRIMLRQALRDREGALADLQELDMRLPPSSDLRAGMASQYLGLERAPDALRQWELWEPTHRNDIRLAQVLNQRCWLRARLNIELAKGLEDCKQAVDKDGTEPSYRDSLGWTYLRLGDASRARKAFDAALERKPLPWAHFGRALALRSLGKAEEAERDFEAARQLNPRIDAEVSKAGFEGLVPARP